MGDQDDPQRPNLRALPPQPGSRDSDPQVKLTVHRNSVTLLTFRGLEEPDLFQAAATWLAEHPEVTLLSVNWLADYMTTHDLDPPDGPLHRLDLTVDLNN